MRLIDADDLIDKLRQKINDVNKNEDGTYQILESRYVSGLYRAIELLEHTRTVEERPTAEWIDIGSLSCRCNACGCKNIKETRFCPHCGAKME